MTDRNERCETCVFFRHFPPHQVCGSSRFGIGLFWSDARKAFGQKFDHFNPINSRHVSPEDWCGEWKAKDETP